MTTGLPDLDKEGPLLKEDPKAGRFECSLCRSDNLRIEYDAAKKRLFIGCERCGNAALLNLVLTEATTHG